MHTITCEQQLALRLYAAKKGRTWKAKLRADWENASALPILMTLRNALGPSWLAGFKFPISADNTEQSVARRVR